ncbi:membrane-associated protein, putative [Bodo saltans]|uniref:Membrane-associated protein, putative n=1 Tax=Bodo saltans TaxID=75058 RepID=A0A0S4JMP8_BODSA|nr:membrane-associated protein, putative [Bodo saltans]|eukprot:CUG92799.1 membrane-associated protein, putative [Bodo saltans]
MLPGAVYGSLMCLSSGDSIGLGALALFLVIVVFVAHYLALTRLVLPNAVYVEYAIPQPTGSWLEVTLKMLPESKWLSYPLVRGFGPLMASRCREYCVMTFSDLFLSCLLAVATGLGVGTKGSSCSYAPLIVAVVYFLYAAALVVKRPHRIPTDKLLAPMISTTYGVMCVLKYTESDGGACGTLLSVLQITQIKKKWRWCTSSTPQHLSFYALTASQQTNCLRRMISTTYGVMCVLKYTESDSGACGTLLSVLQITQMILRMWVMFREQQWQRIEQEEEEERERIRLSLLMLEGDECTGKDELHVNDLLCARASDGSGNDGSGSDMGGALVDIRDSGTAAADRSDHTDDETSAAVVEVLFWDENGVAVGMNGTSVVSDDDATRHGDANESFDGELIMTNHEKMMREQQQHQQNSAVVYGTVFDRRLRLDAQQKKQGKRGKSSMFSLSSYL